MKSKAHRISAQSISSTGTSDSEKSEDGVSVERYRPGDIIVNCRPFVHIIADSMRGRLCDLCLRSGPNARNLLCCKECKEVYFCTSCFHSRSPSIFKTVHYLECKWLAQYAKILSGTTKLFLRLYLRLKNSTSIPFLPYLHPITKKEITFDNLQPRVVYSETENELFQQMKICYEKFNSLMKKFNCSKDKSSSRDEDDRTLLEEEITSEEVAVCQFINLLEELRQCKDLECLVEEDDDTIFDLWKMFSCLWSHTVPIYDESISGLFVKEVIAYSLYLEPSVIINSHSCVPNCAFAHYGPVIQLRAMDTILEGQPLSINYVDVTLPKVELEVELRGYYISKCFCPRCLNEKYLLQPSDLEQFKALREEFVSLYNDEFLSVPSITNRFLNFSTATISEPEFDSCYQDCARIYDLACKLYTLYEEIYPHHHPEKSRFLFAYLVVEMNMLLFKLEMREANGLDGEEHTFGTIPPRCSTPNLDRTSTNSNTLSPLDSLIVDINRWSALLKKTVRNIRYTHGPDHRIFREIPIPFSYVWRHSFHKNLTLSQLHADPTILLTVLIETNRQSSFLNNKLDFLTKQFSQLNFNTTKVAEAPLKDHYTSYGYIKLFCRLLLILFAFLFPFFIYYSLYVHNNGR